MKAPVSLCIIVKNEPLLENCINSLREHVAEIVIVDTGSTDNTLEVGKKLADVFEVLTECNDPATGLIDDFSLARQRSFELASQPWIMWCDADDIVEGGGHLNELVSSAPRGADGTAFLFPYEYAYNAAGQCTLRHYRERLVTNKCFQWVNPVHEVMVPIQPNVIMMSSDELVFKHRRQYSNKPVEVGRNLRILRKYFAKVGESDARQMYYLGLECCNNGLLDEGIQFLIRYIEISGWDDERVMACLKLVEVYQLIGQYQNGLKWAFKAVEINETWAEGYFSLAKMFYFLALSGGPSEFRNWARCAHFAKMGLACPPTKTLLFINPLEHECEIHKYLNIALNKLGDVSGALISVNVGLLKEPNDINFLNNKRLYEVFLAKNNIISNLNKLHEVGELNLETIQYIESLVNKQNQFVGNETKSEVLTQNKKQRLNVVFFTGNGPEIWNPKIVKANGPAGGSELMAMEMAKRLFDLGHQVRVFNNCGQEGIYDGVEYLASNKYHDLNCDVLIVSRAAEYLDKTYNINARLRLLWVHDMMALSATNQLLLQADRILALSNFHKNFLINYHGVNADHIVVTRNAIDLQLFDKLIVRDRFKVVNGSSPDRSWPILLEVWPEIKKQVSQASLHLYYGFSNWEFAVQHDQLQMALIGRIKNQIEQLKPLDVVYHGRVTQEQLANEFMSAGVLAHPTWFQETSGITFMNAQLAGLRIVSSHIGALCETVADRGYLIKDKKWTSPEYKSEFVKEVVNALQKNDDSDRLLLKEYAIKHFDFDSLVSDWEEMFYKLINELINNPIVPYRSLK